MRVKDGMIFVTAASSAVVQRLLDATEAGSMALYRTDGLSWLAYFQGPKSLGEHSGVGVGNGGDCRKDHLRARPECARSCPSGQLDHKFHCLGWGNLVGEGLPQTQEVRA
jgi:hypothetical protein